MIVGKRKNDDNSGFNNKTDDMDELSNKNLREAINAWLEESTSNTKSKLAEETGMSRQFIYKVIDGKSEPSLDYVNKILNAIGSKSGLYKDAYKKD